MSERWRPHGRKAFLFDSPVGQWEILFDDGEYLFYHDGVMIEILKAKNLAAAKREAERIIAARCRDTLKLLGEE